VIWFGLPNTTLEMVFVLVHEKPVTMHVRQFLRFETKTKLSLRLVLMLLGIRSEKENGMIWFFLVVLIVIGAVVVARWNEKLKFLEKRVETLERVTDQLDELKREIHVINGED